VPILFASVHVSLHLLWDEQSTVPIAIFIYDRLPEILKEDFFTSFRKLSRSFQLSSSTQVQTLCTVTVS